MRYMVVKGRTAGSLYVTEKRFAKRRDGSEEVRLFAILHVLRASKHRQGGLGVLQRSYDVGPDPRGLGCSGYKRRMNGQNVEQKFSSWRSRYSGAVGGRWAVMNWIADEVEDRGGAVAARLAKFGNVVICHPAKRQLIGCVVLPSIVPYHQSSHEPCHASV